MDRDDNRGEGGEESGDRADEAKFRATDYGQREQDQGVPKDLNANRGDDSTLIGGRLPVDQEDEDPDIAR